MQMVNLSEKHRTTESLLGLGGPLAFLSSFGPLRILPREACAEMARFSTHLCLGGWDAGADSAGRADLGSVDVPWARLARNQKERTCLGRCHPMYRERECRDEKCAAEQRSTGNEADDKCKGEIVVAK